MNVIKNSYAAAIDWVEDHPHWSFWIYVASVALALSV